MGFLDEYEKRMTTPRVLIDNAGCFDATRVMIDSARKQGILLEAVQVLTDLNLSIQKAYICSDGRWFMDVFHVTDLNGNKITDENVIHYLEKSLGSINDVTTKSFDGLTVLELTGKDRLGLSSEIFAVLSDLNSNIVESKVWTHNGRIASQIYIKDYDTNSEIKSPLKIEEIEARLRQILRGDDDIQTAETSVSTSLTHTERRLHQMMFRDRDYEREAIIKTSEDNKPLVVIQNCLEKGYSVLNVHCKDRTKLLFDVVCTLTDMSYVVYHATVNTTADRCYMEFFIRHSDGTPIGSQAEKQRVILCLQAAIQRRAPQGVRLELCTDDRRGLLADVMRTFRENGLNITRAEISTTMGTVLNIFYVTDEIGNTPDPKIVESVREIIGLSSLKVKELPLIHRKKEEKDESPMFGVGGAMLLSFGSLVMKNLYNLGLVKSYF